MRNNTLYAGILRYYFLAEDPLFSLVYVYGIREYEPYPLQLIRTVPITYIDEEQGVLQTLFCTYRLGIRITDRDEQEMYLKVFENRKVFIEDNEVIGSQIVLTMQ